MEATANQRNINTDLTIGGGGGAHSWMIPKPFGITFYRQMSQNSWHYLNDTGPITMSGTKKKKKEFCSNNIKPKVKHGDVSVMVCGCFTASGPGQQVIIKRTMNSAVHLGCKWVLG